MKFNKLLITCVSIIGLCAIAGGDAEKVYRPRYLLGDIAGNKFTSGSLRGRAVFLTFFSLGCKPCKEEVPFLNSLLAKYPDTLTIVAIAYRQNDPAKLKTVAKDWGIKYPISLDPDGKAAKAFNVDALPRGFLMDHRGRYITSYRGMTDVGRKDLAARLAALQPDIQKFRKMGPTFFVADFQESGAAAKGFGEVWTNTVTIWLLEESLQVTQNANEAEYVVSGNVSRASNLTGVVILIMNSSGDFIANFSGSVVGEDTAPLRKTFFDKVGKIQYVTLKNNGSSPISVNKR